MRFLSQNGHGGAPHEYPLNQGESKMSTHRLFISQPTKDKTNEQIEAERKRAIEAAQNYVNAQLGVPKGNAPWTSPTP